MYFTNATVISSSTPWKNKNAAEQFEALLHQHQVVLQWRHGFTKSSVVFVSNQTTQSKQKQDLKMLRLTLLT